MPLLVTGANGLVGRRLVEIANSKGIETVATDNDRELAVDLKHVRYLKLDLASEDDIAHLRNVEGITGCIHLAAISTETAAQRSPTLASQVNIAGTQRLLEMGREMQWKRFIFASTASVFQDVGKDVSELREDTPPSPLQTYALTKRCGELLVSMYNDSFVLETASVRLTGVYGPPRVPESPRANPIPDLLRLALNSESVDLNSGGDWANTYTYVDDAAEGLLAAFNAPALRHTTYHLTSGQSETADTIARIIEGILPQTCIRLGRGTAPWGKSLVARPPFVGERLKSDTGFEPNFTLNDGIRSFVSWMQKET
ncbi:NAD-dependent epimerase/dehydratase family protein [Cognatishimia activa]|uniref:NAD-dependent epimerase/dehydratase family protein n=1 Tax=Cognatishimia activa TaxID=1715691 RepID=UPI00222F217B|nr:NAD(P)-dependent oxidoreductase [Cognatishimia activa]UZD91271.1 NAD(P)-dependent oxidoreductase [Cognatishimia activa]